MVSLRQVSKSFNSSHRRASMYAFFGSEWAKPTPASQMYSQLSMFARSSALSGPDFLADATVKSGQNNKS
jgi:hypothetical protein